MSQQSSRRQFLRILAAGAGAVVLSNVPSKWKTPVIQVGELPAHAQSLSGFGRITGAVAGGKLAPVKKAASQEKADDCSGFDATITATGPTTLSTCVNFGDTYLISNVPPGNYAVTIDVGCGPEDSQNVTVYAGQTATANFTQFGC